MTGETLYEILGDISEAHILEARTPVNPRKAPRFRWAAAAACLALILLGTAAVAETGTGARLLRLLTVGDHSEEAGFDLQVDVEKIPTSALTGAIREVPAIIRQQIREYEPYSSQLPQVWQQGFPSAQEARDYIGYDALQGLDWALTEEWTTLRVIGDRRGRIQGIHLETAYRLGEIRLQAFSMLRTEHDDGQGLLGSRTTEDLTFTESTFLTESGQEYLVLTSTAMESGYRTMEGYLARDTVLYSLHIAFLEEDAAQAKELLHQWSELMSQNA